MHPRTGILALGLILVTAPFALTQERLAQMRNWDIGVSVAGATGEEHQNSFTESQIVTASVSLGKTLTGDVGHGWRRGSLAYGIDVMPLFIHLTPQHIYGIGFEPLILRWNSGLRLKRALPYLELAGGAVRTDANLPSGDTSNFNFTARGGGGLQLFTASRHYVQIGCSWWHISNANLGRRNPEFNGIQLSIGFHWLK